MDPNQEKKPNEMKESQNACQGTAGQDEKGGQQQSCQNPNSASKPGSFQEQKEKKIVNEAPSKEDWEGGGSRPQPKEIPTNPPGKEEHPYPRSVEAGQKKQDKDFKHDQKDWPKRNAG